MSIRLDAPLEDLRRRRGSKWTAFDAEVLPAWVADMDFPIARSIEEAILDVLERNDVGYPGEPTLQALATAFAQRMSDRFGWQPDPARVMPVGDLIQALIASVATFSQPGEGVVVQTPIYHPFLKIVAAFGRRLVDNPLVAGRERYEMDLDHLREAIDDGTRLVLFCNPHNPTGRVFERRELEAFAALALEHDLVVISDEVHADLVYEGRAHVPLASLGPEIAARTITLTSATKAFNIAGLKCSRTGSSGSPTSSASRPRSRPGARAGNGSKPSSHSSTPIGARWPASCRSAFQVSGIACQKPATSPGSIAAVSGSPRARTSSSSPTPASPSATDGSSAARPHSSSA
jgi:bifunctional pyridoxal-dependent enzyme with beta-cystathionase and maltose regulon repressor activities